MTAARASPLEAGYAPPAKTTCSMSCIVQCLPLLAAPSHLVRHIKHDNDAVRAAVVAAGDGAEALLACRVPLQSTKGTQQQEGWVS